MGSHHPQYQEKVSPTVSHSRIPFNKPFVTGKELSYIEQALANLQLSGNGYFTERCQSWLEENMRCKKAFLTHSGTAALEMSALLADIQSGDEVIMPSFTFVTTASAFVLRGAIPIFVDIRPDTLNLDENLIDAAITSRTKAIVPVHYAGVSCKMERINEIASAHNLAVIEDAAHAVDSTYADKPVGCMGKMAALSFHETKNIIAGEAGALLINEEALIDKAFMVWEKGTNRREFYLGQTDKYTWKELGSSFPPSELTAAFLFAQMESAKCITQKRMDIWNAYNEGFKRLESEGLVERPCAYLDGQRNGHIYYLLLNDSETRDKLLLYLNERGVKAVFHYIPLHSSPAGKKFGRSEGKLPVTIDVSQRLLRLPLWVGLSDAVVAEIIHLIEEFFSLSD